MAEDNTLQEMLGTQAKADVFSNMAQNLSKNPDSSFGAGLAAFFAGRSISQAADAKARYLKQQEQKDAEKIALEAQEKAKNTLINASRAITDISQAVINGSISPQSASDMTAILMGDKGMGFGGYKVDFHNKQISVDGKLDPESDKIYTFTQNASNPKEYTYMDENGAQQTVSSDRVLPIDKLKARAALSLAEKKVNTEISRKKNIEADTQKKLAAKPAGAVKETPKNTIVRTWLAVNKDILKNVKNGTYDEDKKAAIKAAYLSAKSQGIEDLVSSDMVELEAALKDLGVAIPASAAIEAASTKLNEPIPGVSPKTVTPVGQFKIIEVE